MKEHAPYVPDHSPVKLNGKGLRLAFIDENNENIAHAVSDKQNLFKEWF